ncbi:actin-associated protein FAM107A isoform X2 [Protopterus annectens]|uniref:actin-associated protein FAM107A isoform X2 n=1 Tax=Protopterus annectens TaxID=7888 RepID=UPI001CF93558|nr:actin-associated protein FAM107A isoform X2 [Protopterus annectens]
MAHRGWEQVGTPAGGTRTRRGMLVKSASLYSDLQRDRAEIGSIMAQPDYLDGNPDLIRPKKLMNPIKASKSHQELHRELLMNHKRGLVIENKPELQKVLEHRRREQIIRQRKEEEDAKIMQSPFAQELRKRQLRLEQLEREQEELKEEQENTPEFIKVKENLRRTSTLSEEKAA